MTKTATVRHGTQNTEALLHGTEEVCMEVNTGKTE